MSYEVGDSVILDNIECIIAYKADTEQEWGRYILIDKNHDLSFYLSNSDFIDEAYDNNIDNGYINEASKYGYEWGGYETLTNMNIPDIGKGLSNTNNLINLNLSAYHENWTTVFQSITQFRNTYGNKWFLPAMNEYLEIAKISDKLNNISKNNCSYYWTSTESSNQGAVIFDFQNNSLNLCSKGYRVIRTRLCRYTANEELKVKDINITCSTSDSQIYYTTNNTEPNQESILFQKNFTINEGTTIKAKAYKEGYIDSNIAELKIE